MKLEASRLKVAIFSGLSSLICIFLVAGWLEWWGIPDHQLDDLLAALEREGVSVDVEHVSVGIFGGLQLRQVTVRDPSLGDWPLLQAEGLAVGLDREELRRGNIAVKQLVVQEGRVSIPLLTATGDPTGHVLRMHNLNARIEADAHAYVVRRLRAQAENALMDAQGQLLRDRDQPPVRADWAAIVGWLRNRQRLMTMDAELQERLLDLQELLRRAPARDEAALRVRFRVPLSAPQRSRVTVSLLLEDVAWRGLPVAAASARLTIAPERWTLEDLSLQLAEDEPEWLHASGVIDPQTGLLDATAVMRLYPRRLLIMASSDLLKWPYFPVFHGPPPYVSLRIEQSPLLRPSEWRMSAYGEVETAQVLEGRFHSARGHVSWDGDTLRVTDFRGILSDETLVQGDYWYRPHAVQMQLDAQVDGDPRFVTQFTRGPRFRRLYATIWEQFEWRQSVAPHFDFSLYRWPAADEPHFIIQGKAEMRDLLYRGQSVDQASADITVDISRDLLLVNNLHIVRNERAARANLAWHFHDDDQLLRFDMASELEAPVLLRLIQPTWDAAKTAIGLSLPRDVALSASGTVPFAGSSLAGAEVKGQLRTPRLRLQQLTADEVTVEATLAGGELAAELVAGHGTWRDNAVEDLAASVQTDFATVHTEGTAGTLRVGQVEARQVRHTLNWADGAVSGELSASSGVLTGPDQQPVVSTGGVELKPLAWADGTLSATVAAHEIVGQDVTMGTFQGSLRIAEGTTLAGSVSDLRVTRLRGSAASAELRLTERDGQLQISADMPRLTSAGGITLEGLRVDLREEARGLTGIGQAARVTAPTLGTLDAVYSTFQLIGETTHFQATAASMASPPQVSMEAIQAFGTATGDSVVIDLSADRARLFERFDVTDLHGPLAWQNDRLDLNNLSASAYDGDVRGQFHLDLERDLGSVHLVLRGLQLESMPTSGNDDGAESRERRLAGSLQAQVGADFEIDPAAGLLLHGNGEFTIEEGTIWQFPVLSEFLTLVSDVNILSKLLPTDEFGTITQMRSTFELQGDRVHFDSVRTNGTLLALTGDGYYWWKTQGIDFRLHAHLLRKLLPIPIFKPFMIFFERRRLGTLDEPKWEELTALRDVFRSDSEPRDPTAPPPESSP